MRINNNLMAMNTHRQLGINSDAGSKSIEKLSSGYRINRAGDDAAGLAISEKMRAQIRGLSQSSRNAQDSISLVQTAEGALNETQAILQRMRELAVQSANDTNVDADRSAIQNEVDQLAIEITRVANNTEFNERKLLDGGLQTGKLDQLTFHIGANTGQNMQLSIAAMDAKTLGVSRDITTDPTATPASTGNTAITSATFGTTLGPAIVDGAQIDFAYTAGSAATYGEVVGGGAAAAIVTGGDLNLEIDGTAFAVTLADGTSAADTVTAINTAANTALGTVGVNYASLDGGVLEVRSWTTGTGSSVEVVSATGGGNTILANTGLSVGSDTGADAVADSLAITTVGGQYTQTVSVTGTDNSLTVSSGAFQGLTIGTGSDTLADIHADDLLTVAATTTAASAAVFSGGALQTQAVTQAGINVSTQSAANSAITTINNAITLVSDERAKLGAVQNRLEHTIKNLDTSAENLQASESRIRDVDMAKEMMNFTKNNILQQAAQAMLAQANQAPQGVLQLLS
jgi:flagellin